MSLAYTPDTSGEDLLDKSRTDVPPSDADCATVQDVLFAATTSHGLSDTRVLMLWTALTPDWPAADRESFLSQADSQHLLALGTDLRPWLHKVGEKYLKMTASEYTVLREPQADTGRLTFATQSLLHEEELQDVMVEVIEERHISLAATITRAEKPQLRQLLLTMLCLISLYHKDSLAPAAAIVTPLFAHSTRTRGRYLSRLVGVLAFLLPTQNFREYDVGDRLQCVWQELVTRGEVLGLCVEKTILQRAQVTVSANPAPQPRGDVAQLAKLPHGCVSLSVDQLYRAKKELTSVQFLCQEDDYEEAPEWRECTPLEVFEAVIGAAQRYRAKIRQQSEAKKGVPGSNTLQLANPGFFMNALHSMLRFQGALADRMQAEGGLIDAAQRSAGWLPLQCVTAMMSEHLRECHQEAPDDVDLVVRQMLTEHDAFGRFQIGVCDVGGSVFAGRICCRATYGHRMRKPLYAQTILSPSRTVAPESASGLPLYGWVLLDGALRSLREAPGLICYDNIPFVAVFASRAVRHFRRYKETVLQSSQYDEKLKSTSQALVFAQVALRAVARDAHCTVYASDSDSRWYVAPGYTFETPSRTTSAADDDGAPPAKAVRAARVLPKFFFTGRRARLSPQQERGSGAEATLGDQAHAQTTTLEDSAAATAVSCVRAVVGTPDTPRTDIAEFAEVVASEEEMAEIEGQVFSTQRWRLTLDSMPQDVLPPLTSWEQLLAVMRSTSAPDATAATTDALPHGLFPFVPPLSFSELTHMFADYSEVRAVDDPASPTLPSLLADTCQVVSRPRLTQGCLSLDQFTPLIQHFTEDSEQYVMWLSVPKTTAEGAPYANRTEFLKALKEFVRGKNLTFTLRRTAADAGTVSPTSPTAPTGADSGPAAQSAPDVYELRKSFLWKHSELEGLVAELGLSSMATQVDQLNLIRTALTRECENKQTNYERLEFVGDALMDFIVSLDACILKAHLLARPTTPRHTGADQLQLNVVMTVCRNSVIAQLLPATVSQHLSGVYQQNEPAQKVKADMFEALVGAVYELGGGIEEVRRLLMRLFSRLRTLREAPDISQDIVEAFGACPYTVDVEGALASMFRYPPKLLCVIPRTLRKLIAPLGDTDDAAPNTHNTHTALVGLPRIQAKGFATHFTTGTQYSYRRVHSRDARALWHRLLMLVARNQVAFVNETVTHATHLVFDYDGEDIRSFNVLRHFWRWYRSEYKSGAAMLVLDCTGPSPSKQNAVKRSCHVHFPQITLTLPQLGQAQSLFRDFLKAQHERDRKLVAALQNALSSPPAARGCAGAVRAARAVFSSVYVQRLWRACRATERVDTSCVRDSTPVLGAWLPELWHFCPGDSLVELSHVCRWWRRSVLQFANNTLSRDTSALCRSFGVVDRGQVLSDATDDALAARLAVGRVESSKHELVVVDAVVADDGAGTTTRRWIVPGAWLQTSSGLIEGFDVDTVVDASLEKSKKLRMYLCDKCDMKYGAEHRPLLLETLVTSSGVAERVENEATVRARRASLAAAVKPPPHIPDGGETSLWRRAFAAAAKFTHGDSPVPPGEHDAEDGDDGDCHHTTEDEEVSDEELPLTPLSWAPPTGTDCDYRVVASHSAVLRLTSLRSPSYRDSGGRLYEAWQAVCESEESDGALSPAGVCDELPTFEETLTGRRRVSARPQTLCVTQWALWVNAFALLPPKGVANVFKHAVSPSWWAYDAHTRRATFYVATEPVFAVHDCDNLHHALRGPDENGKDGMRLLARWLVPHLNYPDNVRVEAQWTAPTVHNKARRDFLPLFVPLGGVKKQAAAVVVKPAGVPHGGGPPAPVTNVVFRTMHPYSSCAADNALTASTRFHAMLPIRELLKATLGGLLDDGRGCLICWESAAVQQLVLSAVPWARLIEQQTTLASLPAIVQRCAPDVAGCSPAALAPLVQRGLGAVVFLHGEAETCAKAICDGMETIRLLFSSATHLVVPGVNCIAASEVVMQSVRRVLS